MEVFCLRVTKAVAGKKFPFDRVYLVAYDDREVIERMFRYALVLPVEDKLLAMLKEIEPDQYINRTMHRNDKETAAHKMSQKAWHATLKGEWVMVVPILPKWVSKNMPKYLVAENWYRERLVKVAGKGKVAQPVNESPFTNRSYLQTPHKKIRPICVVCPRMILHQNGECQIGQEVCFETLPMGLVNHFEEADNLPDPTPNVNELEEYELLEGEVLLDEKPPVPNTKTKDLLRIIHE